MDWIEGQLDDESIFPQKLGNHCLSQIFDVGMVVCTLEIVQALLIYLSNFDTNDTDLGFSFTRHTIPAKLQGGCKDNFQALVSCLCPHISLQFSEDCQPQGGGPS